MGVAELISQQLAAGSSSLPTVLFASIIVLLLLPKLRQFVLDVLETIIASFLLLVLIVVVLGLPFAAIYIAFKGAVCTVNSVGSVLFNVHDLVSFTAQTVSHHS